MSILIIIFQIYFSIGIVTAVLILIGCIFKPKILEKICKSYNIEQSLMLHIFMTMILTFLWPIIFYMVFKKLKAENNK